MGCFFSDVGNSLFVYDKKIQWYILAFGNTKLFNEITRIINQTMHFKPGNMMQMPLIYSEMQRDALDIIVKENIEISRTDWDSYETSWDFKRNPMV